MLSCLAGRCAFDTFIALIKVAHITETARLSNVFNALIFVFEHGICKGDSVVYDVLGDSHSHVLLENTAEMIFADVAQFTEFINGYVFGIVVEDFLKGT